MESGGHPQTPAKGAPPLCTPRLTGHIGGSLSGWGLKTPTYVAVLYLQYSGIGSEI